MARGINKVFLIGRLTRDPGVKVGQSGKVFTRFSIAVDRTFKKGEADFINCVAFGKTAEIIGEHLRKGSKAGFNGSLQMSQYEKDGEKRTSYEVIVNQIEFLDSKGSAPAATEQPAAPEPQHDTDSDLEFPFK